MKKEIRKILMLNICIYSVIISILSGISLALFYISIIKNSVFMFSGGLATGLVTAIIIDYTIYLNSIKNKNGR